MAYIINHKEIKDGVIMKTQDNVIYKIMHVIGPEDSWRGCDRLWVIEVRIIKGVNIAYTSNENGLSRDTIFVMKQHPDTLCAWIHNVSENELDRFRMLGVIEY
jgi:hypothetical protein